MGVDALGNDVEANLTINDEGEARFSSVLPGDYNVEIPAVPFLRNAATPTSIPVTSAADDGDATVIADLGRLRPEFISIRDWLGSAPTQSILVAIAPGESSTFSQTTSTTTSISDPEVELDAAGSELTIRGTDGGDPAGPLEATVAATESEVVQVRGEADGMRLLRIDVGAISFDAPAAASVQAEGELVALDSLASDVRAEGESIEEASLAVREDVADSSGSLAVGGRQPEAESVAAQAVTVADLFVPVTDDGSTRSDAAVLPLESGELWVADASEDRGPESSVDAIFEDAALLESESSSGGHRSTDDRPLDESAVDAAIGGDL